MLKSVPFGYDVYCGEGFHYVGHYYKRVPFNQYLAEARINLIVVTRGLVTSNFFRSDPEWQTFMKDYQKRGFKRIEVPNSERFLLVHETVLATNSTIAPPSIR